MFFRIEHPRIAFQANVSETGRLGVKPFENGPFNVVRLYDLRTVVNGEGNGERDAVARSKGIGQAQINETGPVNDLVAVYFALRLFDIMDEMPVRIQPAITDGGLKARFWRKRSFISERDFMRWSH